METRHGISTIAVFMFHSTFVMNYITWNTIVSLYPRMMAKKTGLLNTNTFRISSRILQCLVKYKNRGFMNMRRAIDWIGEHKCSANPYCAKCTRTITDSATMRLNFGPPGVAAELIDGAMTWNLATRYSCMFFSYWPSSGMVRTGSGRQIGECG